MQTQADNISPTSTLSLLLDRLGMLIGFLLVFFPSCLRPRPASHVGNFRL